MKRLRYLGFMLIVGSVIALAWIGVTVVWQEPITGIKHEVVASEVQHQYETDIQTAPPIQQPRKIKVPKLEEGHAVGKLTGNGISSVVVMGSRPEDLVKGPGLWNERPGQGGTTVISGHRTTYGAPFRHIDQLKTGDILKLKTRWGTFRYRVTKTRIVTPDSMWVRDSVGYERLVLTACHPVYSASHRFVVFAKRLAS